MRSVCRWWGDESFTAIVQRHDAARGTQLQVAVTYARQLALLRADIGLFIYAVVWSQLPYLQSGNWVRVGRAYDSRLYKFVSAAVIPASLPGHWYLNGRALVYMPCRGGALSTEGSEPTHMRTQSDLSYERGYEWPLLVAARARNPNIVTYGLPWTWPGWVGGPDYNDSPWNNVSLPAMYVTAWVQGAKQVYNVSIDVVGIWYAA